MAKENAKNKPKKGKIVLIDSLIFNFSYNIVIIVRQDIYGLVCPHLNVVGLG